MNFSPLGQDCADFDPKKQYRCAECAGIFDFGWTDEEAAAEQEANGWSDIPPGFMAVVCDNCYKAMGFK